MKVKFVPQEVEFEIKQGQSVMDLAHEKGIPIRSTCNGLPSCAECRIKVIDGDYNTNPPSRKELGLIGTGYYIDQRRLSCQLLCFGDITVDTQEQVEKSAEGPVTKKFLTKVHKATAQESHSIGGVLLEQDEKLMTELKNAAPEPRQREDRPQQGGGGGGGGGGHNRGGGQNRGGGRDRGGGRPRGPGDRSASGENRPQQGQGGDGNRAPNAEGGGGRRRRRGGRGRGRGGGGGNAGGGGS